MKLIKGHFGVMDWIVFGGTLLISLLIGLFYIFIKKQKTKSDLLVGGREMAIFPVAASLLATYMSAILVLGFTGEVYSYGTLIAEFAFVCLVYAPVGACLFLPTLYNLKLTSVYEYLELRFDSVAIRLIATATFMTQLLLYMGVVLYAPSLALNLIVSYSINWTMFIIGLVAAIYTSFGGFRAVVWTDVFQISMMLAGILSIIIQGSINLGGFGKAFEIANQHGRIEFFNFKVDPYLRYSSLSIFFGGGLGWLNTFGCHQTTVQRYCSMSTLKRAFWALMLAGPFVAITMSLAIVAGIVIFSNYAGCDPLTLGFIKSSDQIAPYFVLEFLSPTAGLLGLFLSCLFSGSLSTISSGVNSLTACTWEDFLKRISFFRRMTELQQGVVVKIIGFVIGLIIILMGFLASQLGGVLKATIVVNGAVAGPLLGVFLVGVLTPFVNKKGAIIGILAGHAITFWISIGGLLYNKKSPTLPFNIDKCSLATLSQVNMTTLLNDSSTIWVPPELPLKIYGLSHVLYPLIGCSVTVIVAIIVSLVTGPTRYTKELEPYIHPLVVRINRALQKTSTQFQVNVVNDSGGSKNQFCNNQNY